MLMLSGTRAFIEDSLYSNLVLLPAAVVAPHRVGEPRQLGLQVRHPLLLQGPAPLETLLGLPGFLLLQLDLDPVLGLEWHKKRKQKDMHFRVGLHTIHSNILNRILGPYFIKFNQTGQTNTNTHTHKPTKRFSMKTCQLPLHSSPL